MWLVRVRCDCSLHWLCLLLSMLSQRVRRLLVRLCTLLFNVSSLSSHLLLLLLLHGVVMMRVRLCLWRIVLLLWCCGVLLWHTRLLLLQWYSSEYSTVL